MNGSSYGTAHRPAWVEGMPLLVQNFQQLDRSLDAMLEFAVRRSPLLWGIQRLELRDDLSRGEISVVNCEAILEDGTTVDIPRTESPLCIRQLDQKVPPGSEGAGLYLVLPRSRSGSRYSRTSLPPIKDEFGEASDGQLEVLAKNLTLQVSAAPARELPADALTLKLADISREGPVLRLKSDTYIPPLLCVDASPVLRGMLSHVRQRVEDRSKELNTSSGIVIRDATRHYDSSVLQDFFCLQVLMPALRVFDALLGQRGVHPFAVYQELLRLVSGLSLVLENELSLSDTSYRHEDLYGCFSSVCETILRLLQDATQVPYQWAQRIPHDGDSSLWLFHFRDLSFVRSGTVYLGLKSSLPPATLAKYLRSQLPTVREDRIAMQVFTSGEDGIPLQLLSSQQLPRQGWVEPDAVYCRVRTDTQPAQQVWELICRSGHLSIYVPDVGALGELQMLVVAVGAQATQGSLQRGGLRLGSTP